MSFDQYRNPIDILWYTDSNGVKQSIERLNDSYKITRNKIILSEIADELRKINTIIIDDKTLFEKPIGTLLNPDIFTVNYSSREINLDASYDGKTALIPRWYAVGFQRLPANMIYSAKDDNGNVIETVQDVMDSMINMGKYNPETQYQSRNFVYYGGAGFQAKKPCQGIPPSNGEYWQEMSSPGLELTYREEYDNNLQYYEKDATSVAGSIYYCISPSTGNIPTEENSTYWKLLIPKPIATQLENTVTINQAQSQVSIGITGFNPINDSLTVTQNTVKINKTIDYTISEDGLYIDKISGMWNSGTEFSFTVLKNIIQGISYADGTLMQNGTLSNEKFANNTITDDKLASSNKIGNLSQLNTTDKSSVVNALKEVNTSLIDMANNKVDKNGAGQVTLEMLTQSAREELSGGTVGVVSPQSVSMQILTTDMQNDISSWIQQTLSLITGTHYRITGGYAVENTSSALYHSVILPISSGDRIKLTTQMSSTNAYGYIFVKDDMQVLSSGLQGIGSILAYTDYEVTAPALATKVIICVYNSTTLMTLKKLIYQSIASKEYINGLFKVSNELIFADWEVGGIGTSGANNTLTTRIRTALYHQFSEGNAVITITPQAGYKFCVFIYDASKTFISYAWYTVPFTLVVNKNYFYRFSIADTGDGTAYLAYVDHVSFINDYSLSYLDLNANINLKKRKGKYLSVLGDSISAYSGYIPAGNTAYYTGANSGVTLVSDMWWYKVCEKLGMRPLVINAWSGSKVSSIDAATTPFTPMSDVARCQALHNGSILPDEILIFAGTNDYSKPNANIGTWTGATALPSDNNTFSNAYALMLSRIQTSYPNAKIYCCSLPIFVRTNTEKTSVEFNSEGKTIFEYNEVIRRAANLFGCSYIDLQGCGITRQNAYPTYCEDYSNTPTHPNALGHTVYADHIVKKMS